MPIFIKDITFQQSDTLLFIHLPLKGVKSSQVNVVLAPSYLKVSFGPYIFETCFYDKVDDDSLIVKIDCGIYRITLTKKESSTWPCLHSSRKDDKQYMFTLQKEALEYIEAKMKKRDEIRKEEKSKKDRYSISQQIKLESEQRTKIESIKQQAKEEALRGIEEYRESIVTTDEDQEMTMKRYLAIEEQLNDVDSDEDEIEVLHQLKQPQLESKLHSSESTILKPNSSSKNKNLIFEGDVDVPPPRDTALIDVNFTHRVFPTPLRESKTQEEAEWLEKQAAARRVAELDDPDLRPEDKNPEWLRSKGVQFFKQGNFQAAESAFSQAIRLTGKMPDLYSNRSACHLKMRNFFKAIEDASKALDLLDPPVDENAVDRIKAHVRRGTGLCELECYAEGLIEFEAAFKIDPTNQNLEEDCNKLRQYVQGTYDGELLEYQSTDESSNVSTDSDDC